MFGILLSAANAALGFVFRALVVKFIVFFALWFITTEFVSVLQSAGVFPTAAGLSSSLSGLSAGVWYWLDICAVPVGLQLTVNAMLTRFIIRRIPLIG